MCELTQHLNRDITRLELSHSCFVGVESIHASDRLVDFLRFYSSGFFRTVSAAMGKKIISEISLFQMRYRVSIDRALSDPLLRFDSRPVNIPKGMIHSFYGTITVIGKILDDISSSTLIQDATVIKHRLSGESSHADTKLSIKFTRPEFDSLLTRIGELFSSNGIPHSTLAKAMESSDVVRDTTSILREMVDEVYPLTIPLNDIVRSFGDVDKDHVDSDISTEMLSLAYRVSLFAILIDHIQSVEHTFVENLKLIIRYSDK